MKTENLIEVLTIEGNEVAVSRQGINNCMVNLTQMAKPYRKLVADWLRLKSTQEYLLYRQEKCYGNSHITFDPTYGGQIIVRKGNTSMYEQGTWCTDFHIALDFAVWLDPKKKDIVYDTFIKFLTGRNVGSLVNTKTIPAPKYRDGFRKLESVLRKYTSLDNLKTVAKKHGVTLHHVKDVLNGNKVSNPVLKTIIESAKSNHQKGLVFPDWRIRKKGIDYNQAIIDFYPSSINDVNVLED